MNVKRLLSVFTFLLVLCLLPHLIIWIHHRIVLGLNPFVGPIILIIIVVILFLFIIKWIGWQNSQWFTKSNIEPMALFANGGACLIVSGIIFRSASLDIHLHDTLYIISYYILALCISFVFGIFCFIYYMFSGIFRCDLNIKLSRFHFWITYIGLNLLLGTKYTHNSINRPIIIENAGWASYNQIQYYNKYVLIVLMLILVAQFLFLVNIIYSLFSKKSIYD